MPASTLRALAVCAAVLAAPAARAAPLDAPFAPAGSQAAPLAPDEARSPWRLALGTGLGGMRLTASRENPGVLLFFAGQADAAWSGRFGEAVRLRFRLFTGGERDI